MKLDSRIIKGKKPLDCFDVDIARQFIGKKGYFGTHASQFMDLDLCPKCVVDELKEIDEYDNSPFISAGGCCYCYFLPAEWVKSEKNYRPFTLNEFLVKFPMLTNITMREKGDNDCIVTCTVTAYRTRVMSADICLGVEWISLKELFDKYEYKSTLLGMWTPFGEEE